MSFDVDKTVKAIKDMRIRGALDIAIASADTLYGVVNSEARDTNELLSMLRDAGEKLKSARPTAISLPNSVNYIIYVAERNKDLALDEFREKLSAEIKNFINEQKNAIDKIAEIGSRLVDDNDRILTHCQSDTVINLLRRVNEEGKEIDVICTETRPRYQGRISARLLAKYKIPVTLIVDSAAFLAMKELNVDKVIVGADTIYANGDLINKIGTSQIALFAKELDIDFIVASESIKFSPESVIGSKVVIEERPAREVIRSHIEGVEVFNPAFDITHAEYIDMIITEFGVIPPQAVYSIVREKFGWKLR
ncbi:MAG: ribose 1,5-bisphosphate isomerase [Candidatus Altiarchaeales archaeon]|nr:MAG: ribose 1,5-bisphosphate isomerase [Candidatus Altiarchaeales archaeon]RLI95194.1 MAG: ribose 1,5-bisphosphate isomerase [Candidatus Altiarchaeales archaeon]RLI95421.1 MAG: ribose 1,5-bisphosphate isomerase [Candidatus Altiarchaeales archaeon]HDO82362.1 ribose 1,5-bisphosphate isomerase [Candidatus Altiarchaeales archaeon]HEX55011.1 ribose 1,5-bisphosphate isomerase [Candidatus Altiarchaeales archaeon]